jgi:hypothetical protein
MYSTQRYRKAKKFVLDEDMQVNDEFSGTSKNPIKPDWDANGYKWLGNKISSPERYLESRVGQHWDTIWSDVCQMAKQNKPVMERFIRTRVNDSVEKDIQFVDGEPCTFSRWSGLQPLYNGDLWVHPVTNILCRQPLVKRKKYSYSQNIKKPDEVFGLRKVEYERRISPGVFETVTNTVWFKKVEYKYLGTERFGVRSFGPCSRWNINTCKYETIDDWSMQYVYRQVEKIGVKFMTASKKDIRANKLNKENKNE